MTRVFVAVWIMAFALAATCLVVLLAFDSDATLHHDPGDDVGKAPVLFIGSSLTRSALPATDPPQGILGDGRAAEIRAVNDISKRLANALLGEAIENGAAETIFLEVNAYAHDYFDLTEPAFLGSFVVALRTIRNRVMFVVKRVLNIGQNARTVWHDRETADGYLYPEQLLPHDFYHFLKIEPSPPDELQALLAHARDAGIEVLFFWPPLPNSVVKAVGEDQFAALSSHVEHVAALYGLAIWSASGPWPDDRFMDIQAHANVLGREELSDELSRWYGARQ